LGVYGEELAHGARAAIFGSATLGLAEELVDRGARLVHVYDTDAGRIAEANARSHDRSIFYAPLPEGGDVGVRDGAFDFVLVPDLSLFADPAAIMALVRRVTSSLGAALIASPNIDAKAPLMRVSAAGKALGYYELYEAIATHFPSVRMIGQAPFVGYAVAELSVEDPEPTIDSSLAESEGKEPDWFLALASDRNLRLDPFALIELPVQLFSHAPTRTANDEAVASSEHDAPASSATGTVLINTLEAEREAALESLRQQEQSLQTERFRADRAEQGLVASREEIDLLRERLRTVEGRANEAETRRLSVETKLEKARQDPETSTLRDRLRQAEERARGAEERVRAAEERARGAEERVRVAEERARGAEERVRAAEERFHAAEVSVKAAEERARAAEASAHAAETASHGTIGEHEAEIAKLEAQLRERGHEIQALVTEVDRRDKLVRELVMTNFPADLKAAAHTVSSTSENGSSEKQNGPLEGAAHTSGDAGLHGGGAGVVADLSARLDRLASDAARREADLVGARWRIAQLERELTQQR
jgi:hypothetical protein